MANYIFKNGSYEDMWEYIKSIDVNFNENFIKIKDFYHNFSHSSVLSIASLSLFESDKKLLVLGSNYDAGKVKQYKMEIDRMVNAAGFLKNVIDGVGDQLKIAQ